MLEVTKKKIYSVSIILLAVLLFWAGLWFFCGNDPWPAGWVASNTSFASYSSPIKSLDPATSYYVHESAILDNVVEAPLDYDYLARPYRLLPRLLTAMPEPQYFAADGTLLPGDPPAESVSRVEYLLTLLPDVRYQPHPCFAQQPDGRPRYWGEGTEQPPDKAQSPQDYPELATRKLQAEDFKVALTRLCDPRLAAPIFANVSSFILGMEECSTAIRQVLQRHDEQTRNASQPQQQQSLLPDYRALPLAGLQIVSEYSFKLILSRKYPQAVYWLAMHFFAPIPWEALAFYHDQRNAQAGFNFKNWAVGSGPFLLQEVNLSRQIILQRNPYYRRAQLAAVCGSEQPALERVVFYHEREGIPNWIKFNQGYYDTSGVPADMLEVATNFSATGDLNLSAEMQEKGIALRSSVMPISYYSGFNMLDQTVGGLSEDKKALRRAIAIVLDYQEFIDIFRNGQGVPAHCIIPPGIFGAADNNPLVSQPDLQTGRTKPLPLTKAKELMTKSGFPNGIAADGRPLTLYLDHASAGMSGFKAQFQWLKGKLALLGIMLEERPSDLNRWREKLMTGNWQLIFNKGWVADYPDPENFLFLFYSANGVVRSNMRGANYVNYDSPAYDQLFKQLETMPNGPERLQLIQRANAILQEDAPCCWGFHPSSVILNHSWLKNYQPHDMSYNTLQYRSVEVRERQKCVQAWNKPLLWPVAGAIGGSGILACAWILFKGTSAPRKSLEQPEADVQG